MEKAKKPESQSNLIDLRYLSDGEVLRFLVGGIVVDVTVTSKPRRGWGYFHEGYNLPVVRAQTAEGQDLGEGVFLGVDSPSNPFIPTVCEQIDRVEVKSIHLGNGRGNKTISAESLEA